MEQHSQYPLELEGVYLAKAQEVIDKLYTIPRSGWRDRGVENPETVGEHTDELVLLSDKLFCVPGLNGMLKVHDWPESDDKVGDRRTDPYCSQNKRCSLKKKHEDELAAMDAICRGLGPQGKEIFDLWLEYEARQTTRAIIAYQLDKYQAIMKAIDYQLKGQPVVAMEFIGYDGPKIEHPILRMLLDRAIDRLKDGHY